MSISIADKVFPGIGLAGFGGLLVCVFWLERSGEAIYEAQK